MVNRTEESEADDANTFQESLLDSNSYKGLSYGAPNINNGTSNDIEDDVPELETAEEKRMRKKSHYIVYLTIFIMSIGFSIVLTGVWPYLTQLDPSASKTFLGWVVAANPLGQMIAAPLLGWCGNKVGSNRGAFIATIAMFIAGNVLYALLPLFKENVKYIMVASRFIVGVSSANIAVCRSYIASSTKVKERTTAISITAAAQSMGFILGPSLQTAAAYAFGEKVPLELTFNETDIAPFNMTAEESGTSLEVPLLNTYTLAAWLVTLLGVFNLILFLPCIYKEHNISIKEARSQCKADKDYLSSVKHDYVAISVVLTTIFAALMVYVLTETLIVPMCLDLYAWTADYAVKVVGLGLTVTGVIAMLMFLISGKLANMFTDRKVYIILGLTPLSFAMLVFLPFGNTLPKIRECDFKNISVQLEHNPTAFQLYDIQGFFIMENSTDLNVSHTVKLPYNCDDVGCPASQKWCFYTPIIELPQLIVASIFTTLGYPVSIALAQAIYSKLIKPTSQGLAMGILTCTGSLSRAFGPVFVTVTYTSYGPFWTFGSLFLLLLFILVLNCSFYKRLVPISFKANDNVSKTISTSNQLESNLD